MFSIMYIIETMNTNYIVPDLLPANLKKTVVTQSLLFTVILRVHVMKNAANQRIRS